MSDDIEVYVGRFAVPSADIFGWRNFADTVFSEGDFVSRPRARTHRPLRAQAEYWSDEPQPIYHYLLAPARTVRKRLLIQGYTTDFCAQAWDIARRHTIEIQRRWGGCQVNRQVWGSKPQIVEKSARNQ